MSYILEALRKAERERSLGQAPRLEDVALAQSGPPDDGTRPRRWLLIGLAAAVLVLLIALIALLLRGRGADDAPTPAPVAQLAPAPAPKPAAPIAAAPAASEPSGPPALESDEEVFTLDDLAEKTPEPSPVAPPTTKPAASARVTAPESDPEADAGMEDAAPTDAEPPAPAPKRPAPADTARNLADLPSDFRAQFPTPSLDVHNWNDDPARRFILIGGQRFREGDTLPQGQKLIEIAPAGVVVEFNGQRVLVDL